MKPHTLFTVWSPDEVAECLDGVTPELYRALWALVAHYDGKRRSEWNDDFPSRALANWWDELSIEDQRALNALAEENDRQLNAMLRNL